ncbi:MAG: hydroxymethylglutaryl-CoA synthase [Reinekea sp.]|uniref:hydroxymethylglutaryl-CoA synthase family protein n=2 Tax=Reinekea sp. TaxID=1970455 RepID=UPI00398923C2
MDIGLEAIAFHTSRHYIDLSDLAIARGIEPEKFTIGLGQKKMAIASPIEDTVYLAINAAKKALVKFNISPEEIGTLVVGTETGVDHSKPVAVYIHQALGLPSNCITYETKHACFGAMAAMTSSGDWIASGRAKGRKALIVAADIANYAVGSAAEPTQGAGAVAMVVSDTPKLVKFNRDINGYFTKNVMDFWRPLYAKEAFADGHYSIQCYLEAMTETIADAGPNLPNLEEFSACLYHVPFVKMATKAHMRHFEVDSNTEITKESENFTSFRNSFKEKTEPWLNLNAEVGNIYTGSLFLSLINLLTSPNLPLDRPISLFSYGSGCAASMTSIQPIAGYHDWLAQFNPAKELESRKRLSVKEYEYFMEQRELQLGGDDQLKPSDWDVQGDYLYLGNKSHIRQYLNL